MMMELATLLYNHERLNGAHREAIMKEIKDNSMAPLYEKLAVQHSWEVDEDLLRTMKYVKCLVLMKVFEMLA